MEDKILNVKEIMAKLPHRYPFLMIDRITGYENGKWIKAVKNVTINEHFFQGHFPAEPVMPGVLMVEAMAQAGGVLALLNRTDLKDPLAFFLTMDNVKFRKPAIPGDQLLIHVAALVVKSNVVRMHGDIFIKEDKICEADFMFSIMDRSKL